MSAPLPLLVLAACLGGGQPDPPARWVLARNQFEETTCAYLPTRVGAGTCDMGCGPVDLRPAAEGFTLDAPAIAYQGHCRFGADPRAFTCQDLAPEGPLAVRRVEGRYAEPDRIEGRWVVDMACRSPGCTEGAAGGDTRPCTMSGSFEARLLPLEAPTALP